MINYWKLLWQRLAAPDLKDKAEVERITVLQRAAASRRAEYAAEQAQAARADGTPLPGPPSSSRRRMEEAESVHLAALQAWENRQSRQRSR